MNYLLNMREVTYALSEALDYVGIDDTMHGKRVAYMAAEVAKKLGWEQVRIDNIMMMGMLHDCGVSSTDVHHHLVTELDWDNSQVHCIRGEMLLEKVSLYHDYAPVILYHHTHWNDLPQSLDQEIKENSNLIYLVDRVDALRVQLGSETFAQKSAIKETLQKFSGHMFSPALVEAFESTAGIDSFWYFHESESLEGYFNDWIALSNPIDLSYSTLRSIAEMFADVVDAKSSFTAKHTHGVAALSLFISECYGLSSTQLEIIELTALFHDLGKLRVADQILCKEGPLDEEERAQMNRHGFDSNVILRKIKGFHKIAQLATMHHETLDGKGYPYHLSGDKLPIEARIIAIADIFQALVQNRPYRSGLIANEAMNIVNTMRDEGKLDASIVDLLGKHLDECYIKAMQSE